MKEIVVDSTTIYLSLRWRERERESEEPLSLGSTDRVLITSSFLSDSQN